MIRALGRALDRAFPWIFWAYVAITVAILMAAVVPALVQVAPPPAGHPPPRDAAAQVAYIVGHTAAHQQDAVSIAIDYALTLLNLTVALALFVRRPRDPVARLLAVAMVGTSLAFNYQGHALFVGEAEVFTGALIASGSIPLPPVLNIAHLAFHGLSGAAYAHALLLFPDGRFSPRWLRWVAALMYAFLIEEMAFAVLSFFAGLPVFPIVLTVLTVLFGTVTAPDGTPCTPQTCEPGTPIAFDFSAIVASDVAFFIMFFGFVIPAAGIYALRAKRPLFTPLQRSQSEVVVVALAFAFAVGLAAIFASLVIVGTPRGVLGASEAVQLRDLALKVFPPLYAVIPLSVLVAILRYRLFDIDRLVNRALVYGSLSVLIAATYVVLVVLLQAVLRPLTGGSEIAVAASTLGTLALVRPLRRRVQDEVDRRFYRSRYDAARTLDAFASRLGREVDLEALEGDLCGVVDETMEPRHVSLWLRVPAR